MRGGGATKKRRRERSSKGYDGSDEEAAVTGDLPAIDRQEDEPHEEQERGDPYAGSHDDHPGLLQDVGWLSRHRPRFSRGPNAHYLEPYSTSDVAPAAALSPRLEG